MLHICQNASMHIIKKHRYQNISIEIFINIFILLSYQTMSSVLKWPELILIADSLHPTGKEQSQQLTLFLSHWMEGIFNQDKDDR